jgi:hypothetical protein
MQAHRSNVKTVAPSWPVPILFGLKTIGRAVNTMSAGIPRAAVSVSIVATSGI